MNYIPKYEYIPPLHKGNLTKIYDLSCSLASLGRNFKLKIISLAGIKDSDRVLDVGCATGVLIHELIKKNPNISVIGIDPDVPSLKIAEKRLHGYSNVKLLNAFAEDIPVPDSSVDVIFCTLTLHHMPDEIKRKSIFEMARVLSSGGRVIISDFGEHVGYLNRKYLRLIENPEYIEGNFRGVIREYLLEAGFKNIEISRRRFSSIEILVAQK